MEAIWVIFKMIFKKRHIRLIFVFALEVIKVVSLSSHKLLVLSIRKCHPMFLLSVYMLL